MQKLILGGVFLVGFGLGFLFSSPTKQNRQQDQKEMSFSVFVPWKDLKDKVQANELHGKSVRLLRQDCVLSAKTKLFSGSSGVVLRGNVAELALLAADFEQVTRPLAFMGDRSELATPSCTYKPKVYYGDEL